MSVATDIRWELDALLQRWLDAYPKSVFPDDDRAARLVRHVIELVRVDAEAICMNHEAKDRTKSAPSTGTKWIKWSGGERRIIRRLNRQQRVKR